MPMNLTDSGGTVTLTLAGEVDHHGARAMMEEVSDAIAQRLPRRLILDLSGITFMDSSGIALLLRTHRQMAQLGGVLRVTAIPPQARRVLDAAGIGRLIPLE